MFRGLMNDAKSAVGSAIAHYAMRAGVAAVLLLALGFATAAVAMWLAQRYGVIQACWIMAGIFGLIGVVAAGIVNWQEGQVVEEERKAAAEDTATVSSEAATQAALQLPIALLGSIFTTPLGPSSAIGLAKMAVRNLPLIIFFAIVGFLLWPKAEGEQAAANSDGGEPSA